jgi:hypothetical protein
VGDDIFQLDELVDLYRVVLSNDLEENSNFRVTKNNFVDVDIKELNDVLRTSGHTQIDKDDDSGKINVEDCDGYDVDEIEEEDNSDEFAQHECVMP